MENARCLKRLNDIKKDSFNIFPSDLTLNTLVQERNTVPVSDKAKHELTSFFCSVFNFKTSKFIKSNFSKSPFKVSVIPGTKNVKKVEYFGDDKFDYVFTYQDKNKYRFIEVTRSGKLDTNSLPDSLVSSYHSFFWQNIEDNSIYFFSFPNGWPRGTPEKCRLLSVMKLNENLETMEELRCVFYYKEDYADLKYLIKYKKKHNKHFPIKIIKNEQKMQITFSSKISDILNMFSVLSMSKVEEKIVPDFGYNYHFLWENEGYYNLNDAIVPNKK